MKILFLGQGKLAHICLQLLLSEEFKGKFILESIVTSKVFHEGLRSEYPECRNVHFISNHSRNEDLILKALESLEIEVLISVQHKWILSSEVISAVSGKAFNLHNAKLPDYKGHNTISFAILNNEKEYSVTIHWLVPQVDSGAVILESSVVVDPQDTAHSLYGKMLPEAKKAFRAFLKLLDRNDVPKIALSGEGVYFSKSAWKSNKVIEFTDEPEMVDRKTRASYFPPYEPAYLDITGKKIYCLPDTIASNLWQGVTPLNKSSWD